MWPAYLSLAAYARQAAPLWHATESADQLLYLGLPNDTHHSTFICASYKVLEGSWVKPICIAILCSGLLLLMRAGVANIMAYSWFSHCEKYLKSLEYEKRFMKKQKVVTLEPLASLECSILLYSLSMFASQ